MNRNIVITIISVLLPAVIVLAVLFSLKMGDANALRCDLEESQQSVEALQTQLDDSQQDVADLQTQLADAEAEVASLQNQLSESEEDLADLQSQLTHSQQTVATLQTQLNDSIANVTTLQTLLSECQEDSVNSQTQLTALQTQLNDCQEDVVDLQTQLSEAQAALQSCKEELDELKSPPLTCGEEQYVSGDIFLYRTVHIFVELSRFEEVRGWIHSSAEWGMEFTVQDPKGAVIVDRGHVTFSNFIFTAEMDGQYALLVRNPGSATRAFELGYIVCQK